MDLDGGAGRRGGQVDKSKNLRNLLSQKLEECRRSEKSGGVNFSSSSRLQDFDPHSASRRLLFIRN